MRKHLIIIAGPNGAGKTTYTDYWIKKQRIPQEALPVINPDEIAKREKVSEQKAGRLALERRNEKLNKNESFAIETTFSGHSEIRLINDAKKRG